MGVGGEEAPRLYSTGDCVARRCAALASAGTCFRAGRVVDGDQAKVSVCPASMVRVDPDPVVVDSHLRAVVRREPRRRAGAGASGEPPPARAASDRRARAPAARWRRPPRASRRARRMPAPIEAHSHAVADGHLRQGRRSPGPPHVEPERLSPARRGDRRCPACVIVDPHRHPAHYARSSVPPPADAGAVPALARSARGPGDPTTQAAPPLGGGGSSPARAEQGASLRRRSGTGQQGSRPWGRLPANRAPRPGQPRRFPSLVDPSQVVHTPVPREDVADVWAVQR